MPIRRISWAALTGCLVVGLACSAPQKGGPKAGTNEQAAGPVEPDIDPRAADVLRRMSDTLKNATAFKFRVIAFADHRLASGLMVQYDKAGDITVRRPDGLRAEFTRRGDNRLLVYDGKTVSLADLDKNFYGTKKAPDNLDDMLDMLQDKLGLTMPVADLIFADPYAVLTERAVAGSYLGETTIAGVKVHHLIFSQPGLDWQIWIEESDQPLPRRISITYLDEEDAPRYTATLSKWELQPEYSDETFAFTPPAGAEQIDFHPTTDEEE